MNSELVVNNDPMSPISAIFRNLRTNIQFMSGKEKIHTVLIASTLHGDGKSFVSANLAVAFARTGKRTIIIDADMRKGRQYAIFETNQVLGLSDYLINPEGIDKLNRYIKPTEIDGLNLLPSGNIPTDPSELLLSDKMRELLDYLQTVYDIIIIDGTPIKSVPDSLILSRIVDSTVVVVGSDTIKKSELRMTLNSIKNVGGNIAGVVMNNMPNSSKKYDEYLYYNDNYNIRSNSEEPEFDYGSDDYSSGVESSVEKDDYGREIKRTKLYE